MNKTKASTVMHEIMSKCDGALDFTAISMEYSYGSKICKTVEGYQVRMKCSLDYKSHKIIQTILEKHNLQIDKTREGVVIY